MWLFTDTDSEKIGGMTPTTGSMFVAFRSKSTPGKSVRPCTPGKTVAYCTALYHSFVHKLE